MSFFSNKLKELRKEKGISRQELASSVGFGKSIVYYWENGERKPTFQALLALSSFFNVSIDYLVGRTEDEDNVVVISSDNKLSHREQRLLSAFNKLTDMAKEKLIEDAEFYANNYDKILK